MLNPLTRSIFPDMDDAVLSYLNDDGTVVEPEFYAPILPFALVNGISGIGTGFSCSIPAFNPLDILKYLKNRINRLSTDTIEFVPYYQGFKGTIRKYGENKYLVRGCYEKIGDDKVRITELPVGTWTMPYITMLEGLMDGGVDKAGKKITPSIKDFTSLCTEVAVDITVQFPRGKLYELESAIDTTGINGVEKILKLTTTISTTNMHMFNAECKLRKYTAVEEIIDDFYNVRMDIYGKRKANMVDEMKRKLLKLTNRARYIVETLEGIVDLRRKTAVQVAEIMVARKFDMLDGDYKYLVKMPMDSVTQENVDQILKEKAQCEKDVETLIATSLETMWLNELNDFEKEYMIYKAKREKIQSGGVSSQVKKIVKKPVAKPTK
jgi:DNA topoisomerase-2